ncbi:hypothetical protein HZB00_01695 [Candidatus Woesearchaeota archaeon]|nr:hypothetical protein [Candidatus Woesearchaeota archaeon]
MEKVPCIETRGDYYEQGFQMGEVWKNKLPSILNQVFNAAVKTNCYSLSVLEQYAQKYLSYTKKHFPQFIQEIQGIADGSNQEFKKIWLLNVEEVSFDKQLDHCTSVVLKERDNSYSVVHNEDFDILFKNNVSVIKSKDCTSLAFVGMIPGSSVSKNKFGLIQAVDSLHPKDYKTGVPKNIICRAVLEAHSIEQASKIINTKQRASACNHILLQKGRGINIETTAEEIHSQKIHDLFIHTNHYLNPLFKDAYPLLGSKGRYAQLRTALKNPTARSIHVLLASHNKESPICRHAVKDEATIASIEANTKKSYFKVIPGNPCTNKPYLY